MLLCLLLMFADGWMQANFPASFSSETGHQQLSGAAFLIILLGGVTGIFCFFFRSYGSELEPVSWLGKISKLIEYAGTIAIAFVVSVICGLIFFLIALVFLPEKDDTSWVFFILLAIVMAFVLPIYLCRRFWRRKKTMRFIHPSLRFLLLLPAIFLTTAMMKANVLGIFPDSNDGTVKGWILTSVAYAINFLVFYVGPRQFASGRPIELENAPSWAAGCILYFTGLYFG